jgi:hypothetical protein
VPREIAGRMPAPREIAGRMPAPREIAGRMPAPRAWTLFHRLYRFPFWALDGVPPTGSTREALRACLRRQRRQFIPAQGNALGLLAKDHSER